MDDTHRKTSAPADSPVAQTATASPESTDNEHRKVSFTQSWVLFFRNYAKFSGRSSRSAYWFWALWSLIITIVIEVLRASIGEELNPVDIIDLVWNLAILVPTFALGARRLHDVGRSGWWQLIPLTIVGIIPYLIWVLRAGDSEGNKYGDNVEQGI
tara:strand:- start:44 stop:511 length:468 start_codon:yes stop_codon:yes gene_type:complete